MRLNKKLVIVLVGVVAVGAAVALYAGMQVVAAQRSSQPAPVPFQSPTATSVPSAPAEAAQAPTEQATLDEYVQTAVSLYSPLVCKNLAEQPRLDLNVAVDTVLAQYATTGLSDAARVEMAQRVLVESAAESCPDESARVAEDLAR